MRRYIIGYFLIGIGDFLNGIVLIAFLLCAFVLPSRYINKNGQRIRWMTVFGLLANLQHYAEKKFIHPVHK